MKSSSFYPKTIATLILAAVFTACTPEISILPMGISLETSRLTMAPGESLKLSAEVIPGEATIKTLIWSSDNTGVATVDDGVVTAIAEGNALITVSTKSGKNNATCLIKVAYPVDYVTLNNTVAILTIGKSQRLTATVVPNSAPDISVKWESSNPEVAGVKDGMITANALGTAIITVTTEVGNRKATCTVRVVRDKHILMTGSWSSMSMSINVGGSGTIDINWGDNSIIETFTLQELPVSFFHHYTGTPPFTITIEGEDITFFSSVANQLTDLGFSNMTEITKIDCASNGLKSLAVNGCVALEELTCYNNQLTSLDLSNNTALTFLDCRFNPLTSLNVGNTKLKSLNLNEFSTIEHLVVNNNKNLTELDCSNNRIKSLDLSGNTALTILHCSNNQLTNLDATNNIALKTLNCSMNKITNLDATNNIALKTLDCSMNRFSTDALNDLFETLHINTVTGEKTVHILGNPGSFTCNQSVAIEKGWVVVLGYYMTMTLNPQGVVTIGIYGRGAVAIDWGDGSTESYSLQQGWFNWSFYQHCYSAKHPFTATIAGDIEGLDVKNFSLTSLDISNNTELNFLACNDNQLTTLDVSKNTKLTNLFCASNQLTMLDVSKNNLLSTLDFSNNSLTSLDVSNLSALVNLNCSNNQLSAEALNAMFKTAHSNIINMGYKWMYIENNPGSGACDRSIATSKGWILY